MDRSGCVGRLVREIVGWKLSAEREEDMASGYDEDNGKWRRLYGMIWICIRIWLRLWLFEKWDINMEDMGHMIAVRYVSPVSEWI